MTPADSLSILGGFWICFPCTSIRPRFTHGKCKAGFRSAIHRTGNPQRTSSAFSGGGVQSAAMENSLLLLKHSIIAFLLTARGSGDINTLWVMYKHRGRNGLEKREGRRRVRTSWKVLQGREPTMVCRMICVKLWQRTLEISNWNCRYWTFHVPGGWVFWSSPFAWHNFHLFFRISIVSFSFSPSPCLSLIYIPEILCFSEGWHALAQTGAALRTILYLVAPYELLSFEAAQAAWYNIYCRNLSCLSWLQFSDKAELQKGPGPYPKCARAAEPCRAQFLSPLCLQSNQQDPW